MNQLEAPSKQAGDELEFNDGLLGKLGEWLGPFMDLCVEAASENEVGADLERKIHQLIQWEADLAASPARRPYLWYWRFALGANKELQMVARRYFETLCSASPEDAKRLGGEAQKAIDDAASIAATANALITRWNIILEKDGENDPMAGMIAIAEADAGGRSHLDLLASDEHANELFERVTGTQNCPPLMRMGLRLTEIQSEFLMDPVRFWKCAALAYRRVATRGSKGHAALKQTTHCAQWLPDLREVQDEMFEVGREIGALASQFDRPKVLARALVRCGHQLAERCAPPLLATVLAAFRGRDYAELRTKDIGALLAESEDVGLKQLLFGIDRALRHGDAHKLYRITDDGVSFTAEKREYDDLTWAELLDRVLGGWESVLALFTGILCAVEGVGLDIAALDPIDQFDVPMEDKLRFILAALGWTQVSVKSDADQMNIFAHAEERPRRMNFIGFLVPYLTGINRLTISIEVGREIHSWSGPLEGLSAFGTAASEEDKQVAILRMLVTWTEDQAPLVSTEQLRKVASLYALQWSVAEEPFPVRIRNVDQVAQVASAAEDMELAETVQRVVQGLRLIASGTQPKGWQRTIAKLTRWAGAEVLPPPVVSAGD